MAQQASARPVGPEDDELDERLRAYLTNKIYSVPEVARLLDKSEHEVRTMVRYGVLDGWRVGKNLKISALAVERLHRGGNAADPDAIAAAAAKRAAS